MRSKLAIFKDEDTSSDSDASDPGKTPQEDMSFIPTKDPAERIFDQGVSSMNEFLSKVQKFETITQDRMKDLWRIKDVAFVPLEVRVDVQEYIAGLFDILKPDP
jgi:hypothetical protein